MVGARFFTKGEQVILVTDTGVIIRMDAWEVRKVGRNTLGVRLLRLEEGANLVGMARLAEPDDEPEGEEE